MTEIHESILNALSWRYAVKIFDPNKPVSDKDLETILESGRLAPSSLGIEPWTFLVVTNPEIRQKLRAASYDQPKVTDAPALVVIARRTDVREKMTSELMERASTTYGVDPSQLDAWKQMVDGAIISRNDAELDAWIRAQTYIPLGLMIETASLLGIDNCAMEGFDPNAIDAILGLPERHLAVTTMLALGYRGEDPAAARPKVRRKREDVIVQVK